MTKKAKSTRKLISNSFGRSAVTSYNSVYMKSKFKFTITRPDPEMLELVSKTAHKILAIWAIDCAERVMPYFEQKYPQDNRPQQALNTLETWVETGVFKMATIRKASLDSHSAAREVGEDSPARSAARAAGQAVATAHVPRHAYGSAIYAQQAIYRALPPSSDPAAAIAKERNWQYQHLLNLSNPALAIPPISK